MIYYSLDAESYIYPSPEEALKALIQQWIKGEAKPAKFGQTVEVHAAAFGRPKLSQLINVGSVVDDVLGNLNDLIPDFDADAIASDSIQNAIKQALPKIDESFRKEGGEMPLVLGERLGSKAYRVEHFEGDLLFAPTPNP